jgi:hypothetical protein
VRERERVRVGWREGGEGGEGGEQRDREGHRNEWPALVKRISKGYPVLATKEPREQRR